MDRDVVSILKAIASLPRGLWITFSYLFRRPITIQYPEEKAELPLRFRGRLVMPIDQQKGTNRCTACMRCVTICPNHSIDIEPEKDPGGEQKPRPARYLYNLGTCMFCNLCVEVCPFFALVMSDEHELATTERSGLVIDLVKERYRLSGKKAGWWQQKFRSAAGEE
ncbi:MAG TPA: 4Fe-4S dicluster domain-containing protein [Spirochaetia bacterium]|nr:4Fe-4S dicluster domain-containing protein [Spirochaetia bacterium]